MQAQLEQSSPVCGTLTQPFSHTPQSPLGHTHSMYRSPLSRMTCVWYMEVKFWKPRQLLEKYDCQNLQ